MKNEIKEKFPGWIENENIGSEEFNLCLSDDIDSLFSCIILNKLFPNLKINMFYDFENLYKTNKTVKKCIGVDMDLVQGRCWGNHVTLNNPKAANLNTIMGIGQNNYTSKFCGSTLLQILSYYNVDITELTEMQKMILLVIDSTYLGYWFKEGYYCKKYLKLMEMDCLLDVLERHTKQEFKNLDAELNLNKSKIWVDEDGKLNTNIKLDKLREIFPDLSFVLPENTFTVHKSFEIVQSPVLKHDTEMIFSCARTYRTALRYSIYN